MKYSQFVAVVFDWATPFKIRTPSVEDFGSGLFFFFLHGLCWQRHSHLSPHYTNINTQMVMLIAFRSCHETKIKSLALF